MTCYTQATENSSTSFHPAGKLPWYRGLWWTIWLTILTVVLVYGGGTYVYFQLVIEPSIRLEREAMHQDRDAYMRDFRNYIQSEAAQYYKDLEEWHKRANPQAVVPEFNYQEKANEFRESREQISRREGREDRPKNPINAFVWFSLMMVVIGVVTYPIAKGLTRRLKKLQEGVEVFGAGDLEAQVNISGRDEIALLAQSFNSSAQQIRNLVQEHKNLLSHVSHELRTPLARLRMSAELAAIHAPNVAQDLRIDIKELDELVGEILLASRLDAVPDLLKMSSFDIFALCAEEAARTHANIDGYSIEVVADETLIRRAIRNLLTNAEKYAPQRPADLVVSLESAVGNTPDIVCIQVSDDGPGLSPQEQQDVFKPFYRGRNINPGIQGVGLGLSLVAQIAKRHQGSIVCKTPSCGQGCVFELRVPLHPHSIP